jgi:pimeloyl-[acyl-carrier protein] methyl ester esterase
MTDGQGRLLVLIHGWGFSRAVWGPVAEQLHDLPLWIPDLPGHGGVPGVGELEDVRSVGQAFVEQLPPGTREPIWVGWSMGGLVALAAAARWSGPQRLALVCSTPRFTAEQDWPGGLKPEDIEAFGQELVRDRPALQRRFAALCARGDPVPGALRRQLLDAMAEHPARLEGLRAGLLALAQTDLRAEWSGLDAPVAAWWAADDALIPSVATALKALRPDARLERGPGGHASWLREPAAMAAFLREVAA